MWIYESGKDFGQLEVMYIKCLADFLAHGKNTVHYYCYYFLFKFPRSHLHT